MARDRTTTGIEVGRGLTIPARELRVRATRARGPGGQHVNTSATRIELVWKLSTSTAVTDTQRTRISRKLARRLDADGNVRIVVLDTRSQRQNRVLAGERLASLVSRALAVQKVRRKTYPSAAAVERRLAEKRRRAERKTKRQAPARDA